MGTSAPYAKYGPIWSGSGPVVTLREVGAPGNTRFINRVYMG